MTQLNDFLNHQLQSERHQRLRKIYKNNRGIYSTIIC
jgi:hypothetical protein